MPDDNDEMRPTRNGPQALGELFETETNACNAAIDAKEAQIDAHGYGGPPGADPGKLVGLADCTPSSDTAGNGDTDGTTPNASR